LLVEMLAVQMVLRPLSLGNKHLNLLADQLVPRIAEQRFRLRIHLNNDALLIHGGDCIGNRLEDAGGQERISDGLGRR
jgi:hypothetical protein